MEKLQINEYSICFDIKYGAKLAVVADLHERPYDDIIESLQLLKPSLILLPGDTFERRNENYKGLTKKDIDSWQQTSLIWKVSCTLLKKLGMDKKNDLYLDSLNGINFVKKASSIAPVVMSVGNHEWYFTQDDYEVFTECGVILLDNLQKEVNVNGKKLLFGGLSTRYDLNWLKSFLDKKQNKILLCHHPEYVRKYISLKDAQLVISGHAHGGQIRLFGKGLFSPGQGLFPKYTKGLYGNHLVSAGVANTAFLPRFCNPREICVINI